MQPDARTPDAAQRPEPSFEHKLHVAVTLITKMNRGEITPEQAQRSWRWFRTGVADA